MTGLGVNEVFCAEGWVGFSYQLDLPAQPLFNHILALLVG